MCVICVEEDDLRIGESERSFRLGDSDLSRDFGNVSVERSSNVVVIAEDKGLFQVKANGDDVLRILSSECVGLFGFQLMFEQELFIVWW